ncbi:polysaccharide deacetylase [Flammeovirga pectinis]|uniref:Polysaccharide deacetylase n=1 Tax=Flammeovirga pectinis TaxID=2494373 RepID=A0A3S9NZT9_9BACT|nr:polysaccharide deacetylase family protein [Flammeovirga pectinis]AZQ61442.1 polysaccharide deacetylase [Flammeovirga pectinis]
MKLTISFLVLFYIPLMIRAQSSTIYESKKFSYPNGKKKAVILSYDDGLKQDIHLIKLLDKYHIKGTFNLNSGLMGSTAPWLNDLIGQEGNYIKSSDIKSIYRRHEVAVHTVNHPALNTINKEAEIINEVIGDAKYLSDLVDYKVKSMAYPFGAYNDFVIKTLTTSEITNARTVISTYSFDLPDSLLVWHPTSHHSNALPSIKEYISLVPTNPTVYVLWGHSWEFDQGKPDNNWEMMKRICQEVGRKDDIWYVGAAEYVDYILAIQNSTIENGEIINNSSIPIWVTKEGKSIKIK